MHSVLCQKNKENMSFILFLVAAAIILIVPVKVAATHVQAGRTGAGSCFFAVLVVSALQKGLEAVIHSQPLVYLTVLVIAPAVFMVILDTSYKKGLIIAVVQLVLAFILALIFIAILPGTVTISK